MKNFVLFLLVVALIGGIAYFVMINTNTNFNLAVWQGYSSYASFSKAVDVDEFLGRPLNENSFKTLMALASIVSDDDKLSVDIVSGSKLTERYGVSESLRKNYNYLSKISPVIGVMSYVAYFNGSNWVVIKYKVK